MKKKQKVLIEGTNMDLHYNKPYFSSFLNVTQMNHIAAHHQISLSIFKLQSESQPSQNP